MSIEKPTTEEIFHDSVIGIYLEKKEMTKQNEAVDRVLIAMAKSINDGEPVEQEEIDILLKTSDARKVALDMIKAYKETEEYKNHSNELLGKRLDFQITECFNLQEDLGVAIKALEYYADKEHYEPIKRLGREKETIGVLVNGGYTARQALNKIGSQDD